MKHCSTCKSLTLEALQRPSGFPHLKNARDIVSSASRCDLCNLIRLALLQDKASYGSDQKLESALAPDPIVLYGMTTEGSYGEYPGPLVGIEVHVSSGDTLDIVNLCLWAPRDSPAQLKGIIGGLPLLQNPGCAEGFDVVRHWLETCRSTHEQCGRAFSTLHKRLDAPVLPTRVVDVGRESDSPRLLISKGLKSPYVALSHCWGKKKFVTTVKGNLDQHTKKIPIEALSKTFQEAIKITRKLGLRYLWIDSLCIVQDDADDWRRESAVMGRVYQYADLTIAATGAVDGSQGCFIERSPPAAPHVALPDGKAKQVFIGLYPDAKKSTITPSALGERAWITQEWMLSTRTIHYTLARMVWTCKEAIWTEDGEVVAEAEEQLLGRRLEETLISNNTPIKNADDAKLFQSKLPFYSSWCDFVSAYTCRKLTMKGDRPVAMLGVANVLQEAIHGRYVAGFICEKSDHGRSIVYKGGSTWQQRLLMAQLFWFFKHQMNARPYYGDGLSWEQRLSRMNEMTRPKELSLQPSWSWLSTLGPVAHHIAPRSARFLAKDIGIHDDGEGSHDHVENNSGLVLKLQAPLTTIDPDCFRSVPDQVPLWAKIGGDFRSYHSRTSLLTGAMLLPGYLFFMTDKQGRPLGWASFDTGKAPKTMFYAIALSSNHQGEAFDAYNVLYLEPVPGHVGTGSPPTGFRRLGMGEILDESQFTSSRVPVSIY